MTTEPTLADDLRFTCAWCKLCNECRHLTQRAANEIERLQARVAELERFQLFEQAAKPRQLDLLDAGDGSVSVPG